MKFRVVYRVKFRRAYTEEEYSKLMERGGSIPREADPDSPDEEISVEAATSDEARKDAYKTHIKDGSRYIVTEIFDPDGKKVYGRPGLTRD